jgi:WS/DGAT/MGAT family acyltransferase
MSTTRPDRLSYQDATFAYFDRDQFPYNVGSVGIFEGDMPIADYIRHVEGRLDRVPRYRERIVEVPFGLDNPTWNRDPAFDIANHIREADLPGTVDEEALRRFAGSFFATPLDRSRPLWEIRLVRGLPGGRTAHVAKVHHCMVDGVGGAELLGALLDVKPDVLEEEPARDTEAPLSADPVVQLVDAVFDRIAAGIDLSESVALTLLQPSTGVQWVRSVGGSLWSALRHAGLEAKRKPWSTHLTSPRRLAWQSVPFDEVHDIAAKLGGKVNDVVLTILAGALERYVGHHSYRTDGVARVLIPVNVRSDDEEHTLGNRVSFMLAGLPLDASDPIARFQAVHSDVAALKAGDQAGGVEQLLRALGRMPPPMQRLMAASLTIPNFLSDMVCTNVPGPRIPLYCMGHRMVDHYPWVPLGWRMGMSLAVMTYDTKLYFSLTADESVMTDLERLAGYLGDSYEELREAVLGPVRAADTWKDVTRSPARS